VLVCWSVVVPARGPVLVCGGAVRPSCQPAAPQPNYL